MRMYYAGITAKLSKQYRSLSEQQRKSRSGIDNSKRLAELNQEIELNTNLMLKYPVL